MSKVLLVALLAARAFVREMFKKALTQMEFRTAAQTHCCCDSRLHRIPVVVNMSTVSVHLDTGGEHDVTIGAMNLTSRGTSLHRISSIESSKVLANAH